ncbi:MAG: ATP-binding cassette domain-containing protein [Thermodesulfobacteriota bacterium]|nr:ATP-binding cassette domain-containing protein [Thermodesulfobacteriota bacterium]
MHGSLFEIRNLKHFYQNRIILNIPSIDFEEKKIHAITGPNGSGKTTLCSILALLLKPTVGNVFYRGKRFYGQGNNVSKLRKKITMVHQIPFLFNTSVEKNVAYGLRVRKYPRSFWKPKVEECLELMGIEHLGRRQATRLSGGETQRVAMARALAIEPEVLILDEFTANVDRNYVQIMEKVILDIFKQKKITIIVVTHDDVQALRIADKVTYLAEGEIT